MKLRDIDIFVHFKMAQLKLSMLFRCLDNLLALQKILRQFKTRGNFIFRFNGFTLSFYVSRNKIPPINSVILKPLNCSILEIK